ncbi:unnamed protein product [Paramecium sonneborni]|uniref:Uncharacterized protein n=1 Tax=Paramecium sonneborni TaxID=65129 RepID=A0A8S1RDD1_9CILI|nr:unnamed protein product [Paramecium sonneborni]
MHLFMIKQIDEQDQFINYQNNRRIQTVLLSLTQLEIHFELDIKKQELHLEMNKCQKDPDAIYQEGLIILLQTKKTCKLFQSLKVDTQFQDDSNNVRILLLSGQFMNFNKFYQTKKLFIDPKKQFNLFQRISELFNFRQERDYLNFQKEKLIVLFNIQVIMQKRVIQYQSHMIILS